MRVAVGVDAGGTSTVALASRDGVRAGSGRAEPGNASSRGIEGATGAMVSAIDAALDGSRPDAIYVGAAGAGRPAVADAMRASLERRYPGARVEVGDDARIALRAGVPDGDGVVLIAGTGSIAYAEVGDVCRRAGGHGYAVDDAGSGFAIGSAAARLLARAYDGRVPQDATTAAVAEALGVDAPGRIADAVYLGGNPVATLAALAPTVIRLADGGERSAMKIVQAAALDLGELIRAVVKESGASGETPIVLAGGLFKTNSLLSYLLETRLHAELPTMPVVKNVPDPVFGALALAERALS